MNAPELDPITRAALEEQAQRLRETWTRTRDAVRAAPAASSAYARLADLAAAYAGMATRVGRADRARDLVGDALAALRTACMADRNDPARHVAFARTLELAAACEAGRHEPNAAFDALRAAIATVGRFAPTLRDPTADPLLRLAIGTTLLRSMSAAGRMVADPKQRLDGLKQEWEESRRWARTARGAADHAVAVEAAVTAAFALAVEEYEDSAGDCLERCERLRPHIDALTRTRGDDAVVRMHRVAFTRLTADAWMRLGDLDEANVLLTEAARHLDAAAARPDHDARAVSEQRRLLESQRAELDARRARGTGSRRASAAS
jgi:tetratricopeptide (TPR) repeat protein